MPATNNSEFTVLVTGDAFLAWDIIHDTGQPNTRSAYEPSERSKVYRQSGGAWHTTNILTQWCAQENAKWTVRGIRPVVGKINEEYILPHGALSHAYTIWTEFPRDGAEKQPRVVRVQSYVGTEISASALAASWFDAVKEDDGPVKLVVAAGSARPVSDTRPQLLAALRSEALILWKYQAEDRNGTITGNLCQLLGTKEVSEPQQIFNRTIAYLQVGLLRERGRRVSRGASWERLVRDAMAVICADAELSRLRRVLVSFTNAGVLIASPGQSKALLVFDPTENEETWQTRFRGRIVGSTTCLGSSIAQHLITLIGGPDATTDDNLDVALERAAVHGLTRMRSLHYFGYFGWFAAGTDGKSASDQPHMPQEEGTHDRLKRASQQNQVALTHYNPTTRYVLAPLETLRAGVDPRILPSDHGYAATVIDEAFLRGKDSLLSAGLRSSLAPANTRVALNRMTQEIVELGPERALALVPRVKYGELITTDPGEIDALRAIAELLRTYADHPSEKPLSIAVFGHPGSGKSFGVTQIARHLGERISKTPLTFNLSQFNSPEMLNAAFHQIRDQALTGVIPLVFWDEFDSAVNHAELSWLRYFLAPMQDGMFQQGEITHAIGSAIFVFAGGTASTMHKFKTTSDKKARARNKLPDFISRLRGFLNVPGLNPVGGTASPAELSDHLKIRRSLVLNHQLKKISQISADGRISCDERVIRAFLQVPKYAFGARSIEAIVRMSVFHGARKYTSSCLPSEAQLDLHVNGKEFLKLTESDEGST